MTSKVDEGLLSVVLEAYKNSFMVQSDFARKEAEFVAMAASLGLITTKVHRNVFSRNWRPTVKGLQFLETHYYAEEDNNEPVDTDISIIDDPDLELRSP